MLLLQAMKPELIYRARESLTKDNVGAPDFFIPCVIGFVWMNIAELPTAFLTRLPVVRYRSKDESCSTIYNERPTYCV